MPTVTLDLEFDPGRPDLLKNHIDQAVEKIIRQYAHQRAATPTKPTQARVTEFSNQSWTGSPMTNWRGIATELPPFQWHNSDSIPFVYPKRPALTARQRGKTSYRQRHRKTRHKRQYQP